MLRLNPRFNWHRIDFKHLEQYVYCRILSDSFNESICKNSSYSVQILENIKGSGRIRSNGCHENPF